MNGQLTQLKALTFPTCLLHLFIVSRDHELDPSAERRSISHDSGGVRPDFQSYFADGNTKFYLLTIEVKKKQQAATVILSDLEKVALELKDCLDNMAKQHVNLEDVRVFGIVMIGKSHGPSRMRGEPKWVDVITGWLLSGLFLHTFRVTLVLSSFCRS